MDPHVLARRDHHGLDVVGGEAVRAAQQARRLDARLGGGAGGERLERHLERLPRRSEAGGQPLGVHVAPAHRRAEAAERLLEHVRRAGEALGGELGGEHAGLGGVAGVQALDHRPTLGAHQAGGVARRRCRAPARSDRRRGRAPGRRSPRRRTRRPCPAGGTRRGSGRCRPPSPPAPRPRCRRRRRRAASRHRALSCSATASAVASVIDPGWNIPPMCTSSNSKPWAAVALSHAACAALVRRGVPHTVDRPLAPSAADTRWAMRLHSSVDPCRPQPAVSSSERLACSTTGCGMASSVSPAANAASSVGGPGLSACECTSRARSRAGRMRCARAVAGVVRSGAERPVAQLELLDPPGRRLRQRLHDLDVARHHERAASGARSGRPVRRRSADLPGSSVTKTRISSSPSGEGYGVAAASSTLGQLAHDLLQLPRRHVLAATAHRVLLAVAGSSSSRRRRRIARSPVWNHRLRHAAAVASGLLRYPGVTSHGSFGRSTISPTSPTGTSMSSSSTRATSHSSDTRPHEPGRGGSSVRMYIATPASVRP